MQDVHFSYDGKNEVIKGVSLEIQPGQTVAFVGPSGGGKTAVSRLAARFWDYQKGSITVGGMDVSRIDPEKLMSLYSIVFQDVTLFDNTILENIRLGRKGATDEECPYGGKAGKLRGICRKAAGYRISELRGCVVCGMGQAGKMVCFSAHDCREKG